MQSPRKMSSHSRSPEGAAQRLRPRGQPAPLPARSQVRADMDSYVAIVIPGPKVALGCCPIPACLRRREHGTLNGAILAKTYREAGTVHRTSNTTSASSTDSALTPEVSGQMRSADAIDEEDTQNAKQNESETKGWTQEDSTPARPGVCEANRGEYTWFARPARSYVFAIDDFVE